MGSRIQCPASVSLAGKLLPTRNAEVILDRGAPRNPSEQLYGVRVLRRQIRAMTVRAHDAEHHEMRLERKAILGLEGARDSRIASHVQNIRAAAGWCPGVRLRKTRSRISSPSCAIRSKAG